MLFSISLGVVVFVIKHSYCSFYSAKQSLQIDEEIIPIKSMTADYSVNGFSVPVEFFREDKVYTVQVEAGRNSRKLNVIIDTGSKYTWVNLPNNDLLDYSETQRTIDKFNRLNKNDYHLLYATLSATISPYITSLKFSNFLKLQNQPVGVLNRFSEKKKWSKHKIDGIIGLAPVPSFFEKLNNYNRSIDQVSFLESTNLLYYFMRRGPRNFVYTLTEKNKKISNVSDDKIKNSRQKFACTDQRDSWSLFVKQIRYGNIVFK